MDSPRDDDEPTLRTERVERTGTGRRTTDRLTDAVIVETAKSADTGISIIRRFGEVIVIFVMLGISIEVQREQNKTTNTAIEKFDQSIQALRTDVANLKTEKLLAAAEDQHYRGDMEKRQTRDEEFRHTVRAYEFAVMGALREVQGKVGIKPLPLPEIKGDD